MAKVKSKYVCQNCGYETAGYLGKCPECASWSSFVEESVSSEVKLLVDVPDNILRVACIKYIWMAQCVH